MQSSLHNNLWCSYDVWYNSLNLISIKGWSECEQSYSSSQPTHLLYCYSQLDYRVRPLVLAVKLWAKKNNINEARFQTLSSYTLSLMMIHYLQTGVSPPVLPCLQRTHSNIFNPNSDIFNLPYNVPQYKSDNKDSIGKLFVGFFQYFSDYER